MAQTIIKPKCSIYTTTVGTEKYTDEMSNENLLLSYRLSLELKERQMTARATTDGKVLNNIKALEREIMIRMKRHE